MTQNTLIEQAEADTPGVDIFSTENPRSVVNIVPQPVRLAIEAIPAKYRGKTEHELRLMTKPSQTISNIRTGFWYEYNKAQETRKNMRMSAVVGGVCSRDYFFDYVLKDPRAMAWIVTPPTSYEAALKTALEVGTDRLMEIMQLPLHDDNGKIQPQVANLVLKAFMLVDLRMKGSIVQKHEIKQETKNLNLNIDQSSTAEMIKDADMAKVEERIQVLQRKQESLARQLTPYQVVERQTIKNVTPLEAEFVKANKE